MKFRPQEAWLTGSMMDDQLAVDLVEDALAKIHGEEAIVHGDGGGLIGDDAFEKKFKLHLDSIDFFGLWYIVGDVSLGIVRQLDLKLVFFVGRRVVLDTEYLRFLLEKVHTDIGSGLEDPHFAHSLDGYTAGGEVGHTAIVEFYAGIGDVGCAADDGYPTGADAFDIGFDQAEDDVEVVYHEVMHHGDISATRIELCEAMHLYEEWLDEFLIETEQGGVESLYVAYHAFDACLLDELDQGGGLCRSVGEGFLDEEVLEFFDRHDSAVEVGSGGGHDIDGIAAVYQRLLGFEERNIEIRGYLLSSGAVGVIEAHDFVSFDLFEETEVDLAEMAGSEKPDFHFILHISLG